MDAFKFLELYAEAAFDLIFADPPYAKRPGIWDFAKEMLELPSLAAALSPGGILVLERRARSKEPQAGLLSLFRLRRYGDSEIASYNIPAE